MSKRNDRYKLDSNCPAQNNINILNTNKIPYSSIIYPKTKNNKIKGTNHNQINSIKIEFNNMNKYQKYLSPQSILNEKRTSIDNFKKLNYSKYYYYKNKNKTKNSSKNVRAKSSKKENLSKSKFYDYSSKINDSFIKYRNKKNEKRKSSKKSPKHKMINYNPFFFVRTPKRYQSNKSSYSKKSSKSSKRSKSSKKSKTNYNDGVYDINDYSLIIYKNKKNNQNNSKKKSNNTDYKIGKKCFIRYPKSINKKNTIALKNNSNNFYINNFLLKKPFYRPTSYDSQKSINYKNNNNKEKKDFIQENNNYIINGIYNYNHISKRNININLHVDNSPINKKVFFSTENNTNFNTNYNSYNNSNNNTIKKNKVNNLKNDINNNKENIFKGHQNEYGNIKEKTFYSQNIINKKGPDKINELSRKKISFDIFDNDKKNKNNNNNRSNDIIKVLCSNSNPNFNINDINDSNNNKQSNKNSFIIRFENKKAKKDDKEEENSEDNGYQFIIENEQGINTGINSVKTNNFIINKPKEENLKYSSIKEFLDDNEEQTEISPSQISKIIIGQIEGYKDIIDEDKNININDKSRSLLELLSKFSFSVIKNNKQSIDNLDNLYLFEESNNDIKDINNINAINNLNSINSRNLNSESNLPNLTNIKNVDEDYDSEDISISEFKNNIKSITTHSKVYLNKKIYNDTNRINKSKSKDINKNNNCIKHSMNTSNTTISSGNNKDKDKDNNKINNINNINNENIKSNKNLLNKDIKNNNNNKNYKLNSKNKIHKKISPSSSARYELNNINNYNNILRKNNSNDKKRNYKNRNEKNYIYFKNINKTKIINNIDITKRQNTIKSSINKNTNINTNIIFNSNKQNKKIKIPKNIDVLISKAPINDRHNIDLTIDEENNQTKKITNYNIPIIKIIGENDTIVNAYFNDIESEINVKNEDDSNKSQSNNINNININGKNQMQCFIF